MKKNKLFYVACVVLLVGLASFSYVLADSDKSKEDSGKSEQAKEAEKLGSTLEVSISNKGKVEVRGAKVTSVSGSTVNASTSWGSANFVWAVNITGDTKIVKKSDDKSSIGEIAVGDFINFKGNLVVTSASPITVNASWVKNLSGQKKNSSFNGIVKSIDAANKKFVMTSTKNGDISVVVSGSTKFEKGDKKGAFTDIAVTSRVLVKGLYDSQLTQLTANSVKVYVPKTVAKNLEGKIKVLPGATAPTTLVITDDDEDYTVNIATDTSILNKSWLKVPLASLKIGDEVDAYGVINANKSIDATVVRDTSL